MAQVRPNREQAIMMTSSAALELFWSVVAFGSGVLGIAGTLPIAMSAVAAIALAFALLAQSGTMAARWPNAANDEKKALADEFNTQRAAYLAKHPPAPK